MANVQLKLGDMFDGPSDLIVLPCSTLGTITSFVLKRLTNHDIPFPKPDMNLGEVVLLPFEGGESIAQYVAYAASVERNSSNVEAIARIGEQLGKITVQSPTIRRVAAPLLGAGAGGLRSELVIEALTKGFKREGHSEAQLVLHVLHKDVFDRVSSNASTSKVQSEPSTGTTEPLRVFISYSHSSPDHQSWVESLGTFLRENGIDARLDAWHLRRGMDLPQFMTNELALAERVIIVADERYAEKADGRLGGVGWETMIVQGDMSRLPPESTKYLVVVRSPDINEGLPRYLKTKFVIHWPESTSHARNRELILHELYDEIKVPEILPRLVRL